MVEINKIFFTELEQKMKEIYRDVRKKEADAAAEAKVAAEANVAAEEKVAADAKAAADAKINELVEKCLNNSSLCPGNEFQQKYYDSFIPLKYKEEDARELIGNLNEQIVPTAKFYNYDVSEEIKGYMEHTEKNITTFSELKKYYLKQKIIAEYEKKNIDTEIKKNIDEIKQYWDKKTDVPQELTEKQGELYKKLQNIQKKLNDINFIIDIFIGIVKR